MINSITVTNYLGESLKLEMRFPEKSGFLILSMDGLGPTKATINKTNLATSDGSIFNSSRIDSRNIVLLLKLLESPTIEATRQKSYKYFPIKKRVRFLIETDTRICETYGYVETNEPNIFSKNEITQISIICPDPYFYSAGGAGKQTTIFSGIESQFSFPFSNESPTEDLLVMGNILMKQEQTVFYRGDSEIGIMIYIHALGAVTNLTIYNLFTRETMQINTDRLQTLTGNGIIAGDDIIISTTKGQKSIQLFRNGIYTNILNCLDKNCDWFRLTKGDNVFAFTADTGSTFLQFRIENQIVYEGV